MPKSAVFSSSINFDSFCPYDAKKKSSKQWYSLNFRDEVPTMDTIKKLCAKLGDDDFKKVFRQIWEGRSIKMDSEGKFTEFKTCKVTLVCKNDDFLKEMVDFFQAEGYEVTKKEAINFNSFSK